MLLDDAGECSARKEGGRHVKIVVSFQEEMKWKEVSWIPYPAQLEEVPLKSTTQDISLRMAHCSFPLPSGSHSLFTFLLIHIQGSEGNM